MHSRQGRVHLLQQASWPCIRALQGWLDFCLHTWLGMPARGMHQHNQWRPLQEGSGPKMVRHLKVHIGYACSTGHGEIQPAELSSCIALLAVLLLNGCCRPPTRAAGDTGLSSEKMLSVSWHAKDRVVRATVHACKEKVDDLRSYDGIAYGHRAIEVCLQAKFTACSIT